MNESKIQHSWKVTYQEAVALQEKLQKKVQYTALPLKDIQYLAAADISFRKKSPILFAAVILFSFPELHKIEEYTARDQVPYPYVPGLLSFREIPVLLPLFARLTPLPDVILVDGQGVAHPRRFGIASHLGLLLNLATIGCAKSRLCGEYTAPPKQKGDWVSLTHQGAEIGRVLCTKSGVKPIFVSVGHQVDLDSAVTIVMKTVTKYRIPEPLRQAHLLVNQIRREEEESEHHTI